MPGVLLCRSVGQALKGAPWVESYSVVQCVRHLMGQPLYCQAANAGVWGWGGEAMVMAPPSMCDPAVSPCFHGCPAFFHRYFPSQSPPSHPLNLSLCSQQQPSLRDCSTTPKLKRGLCIPLWGMYGYGKDSLILIPFRLPQISCFTLSLKCFSSDSDNCPDAGIGLLLQFPHPLKVQSYSHSCFFP